MSKKEGFNRYTGYYAKPGVEPEPYVTLWVSTHTEVVRERNENDEWDSGDDTEVLDDYGVSLGPHLGCGYGSRDRALTEEHIGFMPEIGDLVYMVIEDYGSGSTFGHTDSNFAPVKVFATYKDANDWLTTPEAKRCKDTDYFGGHNQYLIEEVHVR